MDDIAVYTGLFAAALVAATILPMQSEALLAGLLISGAYSTTVLILVASIGNILGTAVIGCLVAVLIIFAAVPSFPPASQVWSAHRNGTTAMQMDLTPQLHAHRW